MLLFIMIFSSIPVYALNEYPASGVIFDFETGTNGVGTKTVTQTVLGNTLKISSQDISILNSMNTSGLQINGSVTLSTDYGTGLETRLKFTVNDGDRFDFDKTTIFILMGHLSRIRRLPGKKP